MGGPPLGVCVVYLSGARVDSLGSRLLFLLALECVPIAHSKQRDPNLSAVLIHCKWPPNSTLSHVSFPLQPLNLSLSRGWTSFFHIHAYVYSTACVCVPVCTQSSRGVCTAGRRVTRLNTQYRMHKRFIYYQELICHRRRHRFSGGPCKCMFTVSIKEYSSLCLGFKSLLFLLPRTKRSQDELSYFAYLSTAASSQTTAKVSALCHVATVGFHSNVALCPQLHGAECVLLSQTQGGRERGLSQHALLSLARVFDRLQRLLEEAE